MPIIHQITTVELLQVHVIKIYASVPSLINQHHVVYQKKVNILIRCWYLSICLDISYMFTKVSNNVDLVEEIGTHSLK